MDLIINSISLWASQSLSQLFSSAVIAENQAETIHKQMDMAVFQ